MALSFGPRSARGARRYPGQVRSSSTPITRRCHGHGAAASDVEWRSRARCPARVGRRLVTVVLTGGTLGRRDLVRVARGDEPVEVDHDALAHMGRTRAVAERALAAGDRVYGLTTGVGVLKRVDTAGVAAAYARRMIRDHRVAQGPEAPRDVVRAAMLRLANAFLEASPGVRPILATRLVEALNGGETPVVRTLGSVGQADLAQMADIAALFADVELAPGEGLALVSSNAFATGAAALALDDAGGLLTALEAAGALSLEGLAANPGSLHPAIGEVRPYPGLRAALGALRSLLDGSALWDPGNARSLQDPLCFRNLSQVAGACRDTFDHLDAILAVQLNASESNPIVVEAEDRLVSVANFEMLPLAAGLDYLRIVLATALTMSAERSVKLLETTWSGLPTGLVEQPGTSDAGLSYLGIAAQAIAIEARLLAQPVSLEMASSSHAEGIEDRATSAPLAARRLAEQVELGRRLAAIELVVAAQACDLRGVRSGRGTEAARAAVRAVVPRLGADGQVADVEPLVELVRAGAFMPETLLGGDAA